MNVLAQTIDLNCLQPDKYGDVKSVETRPGVTTPSDASALGCHQVQPRFRRAAGQRARNSRKLAQARFLYFSPFLIDFPFTIVANAQFTSFGRAL
eukprot:1037927-Pleurochrysis_carterae.AAC.3